MKPRQNDLHQVILHQALYSHVTVESNEHVKYLLSEYFVPGPGNVAVNKTDTVRTSLADQWLRLHVSTAGGLGSIPGRGTEIPHATWRS